MRPTALSEDRRTFWPRNGPAGPVPDLGDDRPCGNCGYNLRGLAFSASCPECGATYGISTDCDLLPWEAHHGQHEEDARGTGIFAFVATVLLVLTRPRDLGARVWVADPIDGTAAVHFRRICVTLATLCALGPILQLTGAAIGWERALWLLPLDLAASLLCFHSFAMHCVGFFRDKGAGSGQRRARALANYVVAPLALTPLHLVLLAILLRWNHAPEELPYVLAVAHGGLLAVQIVACVAAEAALLWQIVEVPKTLAISVAAGDVLGRAALGAIYLGGTTALFAMVANGMGS